MELCASSTCLLGAVRDWEKHSASPGCLIHLFLRVKKETTLGEGWFKCYYSIFFLIMPHKAFNKKELAWDTGLCRISFYFRLMLVMPFNFYEGMEFPKRISSLLVMMISQTAWSKWHFGFDWLLNTNSTASVTKRQHVSYSTWNMALLGFKKLRNVAYATQKDMRAILLHETRQSRCSSYKNLA